MRVNFACLIHSGISRALNLQSLAQSSFEKYLYMYFQHLSLPRSGQCYSKYQLCFWMRWHHLGLGGTIKRRFSAPVRSLSLRLLRELLLKSIEEWGLNMIILRLWWLLHSSVNIPKTTAQYNLAGRILWYEVLTLSKYRFTEWRHPYFLRLTGPSLTTCPPHWLKDSFTSLFEHGKYDKSWNTVDTLFRMDPRLLRLQQWQAQLKKHMLTQISALECQALPSRVKPLW